MENASREIQINQNYNWMKKLTKINEKINIDKMINEPNLLKWEKANLVWYGKDKLLTREAHAIHEQLLKDKVNTKSQKYWDTIDEQLYRKHKSRLAKYFSFDN